MPVETLRLSVDEATAYKFRQIVQDSSSFEAAVRRIAREKNTDHLGKLIRFVRDNGGNELFRKWSEAGRPTIKL
jgi:hypothetical protein